MAGEKETIPYVKETPPGMRAKKILARDERIISPSYVRYYPLVAKEGKGCIITDVDGNKYIDLNAGIACLPVGSCHPKVVEAIKKQAEMLSHYSLTDFYYEPAIELAERIQEITPGIFGKRVWYGNSGTEAVEAAFKTARWHTRRQIMLGYIGGFHGRTYGALSFTASKPVQRERFLPLVPGVTHIPYPYCYRCPFKLAYPECDYWCIEFVEEMLFRKYVPPSETAGILFEPIQGEGGYIVPPTEYFQRLKLADKYDLLLIDDEVQAGTGRTGKWFAIENWETVPDIVCIAKGIASGLPLGVMVARSEVMDWCWGAHGSTFGGNPVSCAASLATIETIKQEKLVENASKQGEYILKRFRELGEEHEMIGDIRGKGLMIGVELVKDRKSKEPAEKAAQEIITRSWKKGVAIITAGTSTLRIAPPLTITKELIDAALPIVEEAIKETEKGT